MPQPKIRFPDQKRRFAGNPATEKCTMQDTASCKMQERERERGGAVRAVTLILLPSFYLAFTTVVKTRFFASTALVITAFGYSTVISNVRTWPPSFV